MDLTATTPWTPGPWIVCDVDGRPDILSIEQDRSAIHEEPSIVAEVDLMGDGIDAVVGRANARLIAAAPELAAHLRRLLDELDAIGRPDVPAAALLAQIGGAL